MKYFSCLLFALCTVVPAYTQPLFTQFPDNSNADTEYHLTFLPAQLVAGENSTIRGCIASRDRAGNNTMKELYYHGPTNANLDISNPDFGNVYIGQESENRVIIWNGGDKDAIITAIDVPESDVFFVELPSLPFVIAPSSYREITVYFRPQTVGSVTGNIVFHMEDTTVISTLAGSGAKVVVAFTAKSLDFSDVELGSWKEGGVAMANTGLKTLQITSLQLASGANFTILDMPELPMTLDDAEGFDLTIRFTPSDISTYSDELIIAVSGAEIRSQLSGRGVKSSTSVADTPVLLPTIKAIYPNPAGEESTLHYTLASTGPVRLALFNTMGQQVLSLFDGMQSQGEHTARIQTSTLPSGMYSCRLTSGDTTVSSCLVIVH